jgi:hypothetical protein
MSEVTMTDAMSDEDDYDSESLSSSSGAEFAPRLEDEQRRHKETTIDLSGDDAAPGKSEPQIEALTASFSPRAYQLEMLEESLRRNVIVAVSAVP